MLGRFANGGSVGIVFGVAHTLIDDANKDEKLKVWFKDINVYVRKVRPPLHHL